MIWNAYLYVFYRVTEWNSRLGERDVPNFKTNVGLSICLTSLFSAINFVFFLMWDIDLLSTFFEMEVVNYIVVFFLAIALHQFFIIENKESLERIESFRKESKKTRRIRGISVVLYVLLSAFSMLIVVAMNI